jgi:hypothetical protein
LVFAKDDPRWSSAAPRAKARILLKQFAPLKNLQVWRFSLYYFFVFGAFVALALWLPHYLIGVYGVDIKRTAGMAAAAFSIPGSACSGPMAACCRISSARGRSCTGPSSSSVAAPVPAVLSADRLCDQRHTRPDFLPPGNGPVAASSSP